MSIRTSETLDGAVLDELLVELETEARLVGHDKKALAVDPFSYGVKTNRDLLDTITQYSFEQGLTPRKLELDEVFAPSTMDL